MSIRSDLVTLSEIVDGGYFFTVPIYQRLYVWGGDQVRTLLEDLLAAYQAGKETFYLGGAIVVDGPKTPAGKSFELIDGQQRFTTLWMLSLIWGRALRPFQGLPRKDVRWPRVTFPIRPDVDRFFSEQMSGHAGPRSAGPPAIVDAMAVIESFVREHEREVDFEALTRFALTRVKLVLTRVSAGADLNKLFEVINNRGIQLQHHEILKARMLGVLSDVAERERYALLWDACSQMGGYVERNLRLAAGIKVSDLYNDDDSTTDREPLGTAARVLDALSRLAVVDRRDELLSLDAILVAESGAAYASDGRDQGEEVDEAEDVRSIITFPMLLQHVLRIWLHKWGRTDLPKIADKELLGLFQSHFFTPDACREHVVTFVELLWEVRYRFDKHIIKWVSDEDGEQLRICRLQLRSSQKSGRTYLGLAREQPAASDGFSLLQSMLYHSQQITTHYWLTPFLNALHGSPGDVAGHYQYLRHLDNHLLCSTDDRPLIERSRAFLDDPWRRFPLDCSVLDRPLGLAFPHYWFYKLEFVLWERKRQELGDVGWDGFRMTAKNSVEHISPQSPQDTDKNRVSAAVLDTFGNLALVSRAINSEYGNLPFNEKRQRFLNHRSASRLDSLKMDLIYRNEAWNDEIAREHQREMVKIIASYLASGDEAPPSK